MGLQYFTERGKKAIEEGSPLQCEQNKIVVKIWIYGLSCKSLIVQMIDDFRGCRIRFSSHCG
jgi:hypothetical protein